MASRGTIAEFNVDTTCAKPTDVLCELAHQSGHHEYGGHRHRGRPSAQLSLRGARLVRVTEVRPAVDTDAARWLLASDVDWWDLVRYGPPAFDAYVRIAFAENSDPHGLDPSAQPPPDHVREALATLASYTTTPGIGYAAIWEGCDSGPGSPRAPRLEIPHREMLLFTGPVIVLRDAQALAWYGDASRSALEPHLVWPQDQAWCLACEVDEEIAFTVGGSAEACEALSAALPGAVRRVRYGEQVPLYRDQA